MLFVGAWFCPTIFTLAQCPLSRFLSWIAPSDAVRAALSQSGRKRKAEGKCVAVAC